MVWISFWSFSIFSFSIFLCLNQQVWGLYWQKLSYLQFATSSLCSNFLCLMNKDLNWNFSSQWLHLNSYNNIDAWHKIGYQISFAELWHFNKLKGQNQLTTKVKWSFSYLKPGKLGLPPNRTIVFSFYLFLWNYLDAMKN